MVLDEKIIFWIIEKFGFCYYELLIPQEGNKDASVFNSFEGKQTQEVIGDLKENLSILGTGTYSIHLKVSKRSRGKNSCKTLYFQLTEPIHKEMPDQSPTGKHALRKEPTPKPF